MWLLFGNNSSCGVHYAQGPELQAGSRKRRQRLFYIRKSAYFSKNIVRARRKLYILYEQRLFSSCLNYFERIFSQYHERRSKVFVTPLSSSGINAFIVRKITSEPHWSNLNRLVNKTRPVNVLADLNNMSCVAYA